MRDYVPPLPAAESGASVLLLERAPEPQAGGNSRFTAGVFRFCHEGAHDIRRLVPDLSDAEAARILFGTYSAEQYFEDLFSVTRFRARLDMAEQLVGQSREVMFWLRSIGVRFALSLGRHAVQDNGKMRFRGDLVLESWGGGAGLIEAETTHAIAIGVKIRYSSRVRKLLVTDGKVEGVIVSGGNGTTEIGAGAVVLACGGFEANAEWRTRYLGPGWEYAKVRGTPYNTGDGIQMALEVGAKSTGNWSGCHSVAWDAAAPEAGDFSFAGSFEKHSYPLGVMVNANGRRFVDEGEDLRIRTYSKLGRKILAQPGMFAWQVFDAKALPLLGDEYRSGRPAKIVAQSLEELANKLEGVDPSGFLKEIALFNSAVGDMSGFRPGALDGVATIGLAIPKSNWARTIDTPPFEAYQVECGITFTFGGIATDGATSQVVGVSGEPIDGLFAAGEVSAGLFHFGYPGGSGLMAGSVFGRLAGIQAAKNAISRKNGKEALCKSVE